MKKILIIYTIVLVILQIVIFSILFPGDKLAIITFNNKEFNRILNNNTRYGFPKSNFIFAITKVDNWFRPKTEKITVYDGHKIYKLEARGIDNEISRYIQSHSNIRNYIMGIDIIIILIYIIYISKYRKNKN